MLHVDAGVCHLAAASGIPQAAHTNALSQKDASLKPSVRIFPHQGDYAVSNLLLYDSKRQIAVVELPRKPGAKE